MSAPCARPGCGWLENDHWPRTWPGLMPTNVVDCIENGGYLAPTGPEDTPVPESHLKAAEWFRANFKPVPLHPCELLPDPDYGFNGPDDTTPARLFVSREDMEQIIALTAEAAERGTTLAGQLHPYGRIPSSMVRAVARRAFTIAIAARRLAGLEE